MNKKFWGIIASVLMLSFIFITGCGENNSDSDKSSSVSESTAPVAGENETVPNQLEIPDDLTPVTGSEIKDGVYDIQVDSSSSMFSITECKLTVEDGKMTAVMTMSGQGYLYVFMGKGEDAVDESQYIPFEENSDGEHTFTVPVEALDKAIDCSAFSKKKEQWYDRTLLFDSSSLPADAFKDGVFATVESLDLSDGEYTVEVSLEGGSGKASVESPAKLTVTDGKAYAEIVWSSSNYDYMVVDGERYEMTNTEGNSTFLIPVTGFDYNMPVSADTIAMSTPHEIEYTLNFDSSTIK